jgi:excisionase family DNA binding protein
MHEDKTPEEIAAATRLSASTIRKLRQEGRIPFVKLGPRSFRYNLADVLSALQSRHQGQEPHPGTPAR